MNGTIQAPWYGGPAVQYPNNDDTIFIACQAFGTVPVNDGSQWPTEIPLNSVCYVRDLSPTNSVNGLWTFNLSFTKGGPAITINSTNASPHMFGLPHAYRSSNPDVYQSNGYDYMYEVTYPVFWLHAIATSNDPVHGLNQVAGFTH